MDKYLLRVKLNGDIIFYKDGYNEEIELFITNDSSQDEKEECKDARQRKEERR